MFKFIRRYQKWMLVVFCGGLMVAFIIPQAAQQFAPTGEKRALGTLEGGDKITVRDRDQAVGSLQTLRGLGFYGVGLYPQEESEADQALAWLLMVRAGQKAGLGASDNEAFTAISMKQSDITDADSLDAYAAQRKITRAGLLGIVKEYLIAEQYRQLVLGHAYESREGYSGSPGLVRVRLENEAIMAAQGDQQWMMDFYGQNGRFPTENDVRARMDSMVFSQTVGHPRVSEDALRFAIQESQTRLSGLLVLLDADESTLPPSDEELRELFDAYRADFPGAGKTYGFGYRVPAKVRIEALRIPLLQVMAVAGAEVTEADVRRYYDQNAALYAGWTPRDQEPEEAPEETPEDGTTEDVTPETTPEGAPEGGTPEGEAETPDADESGEGEAETQAPESTDGTQPAEGETAPEDTSDAEPTEEEPAADETDPPIIEPTPPGPGERVRIDFRLRREIRAALTLERARELQLKIAQDIQRILSEDSRVLEEADGFKVVPEGFTPRRLTEVAQRILEDHGVKLELVADDGSWIALPEMNQSLGFVTGMMQTMPSRTIWTARNGYAIQPEKVYSTELDGRLGLLSAGVLDQSGQPRLSLQQIVQFTRELMPDGQAALMPNHPQVGLVLAQALPDATGSVYIARVTAAQKDRPADSLAEVREDVERDAKLKRGYDNLLAREESLLQQARENTIHDLAIGGIDVEELADFTRGRPPAVEGVRPANVLPLVDAAFELADTLRAEGGVTTSVSADRLIAVAFPYERKLALFLLEEDKPVSQRAYREMIDPAGGTITAIALQRTTPVGTSPIEEVRLALTLEELIRQTGFEYAEGEGPEPEDGAGDGSDSE